MPNQADDFSRLFLGKEISEIHGGKPESDVMLFIMHDHVAYGFYHAQDCCEKVCIIDVCGDWADLIGSPLLQAEKVTSKSVLPHMKKYELDDSPTETWTFYKFATIKGSVTIRWKGESNSHYSEEVSMVIFGDNEEDKRKVCFLDALISQITA